LQQIRAAGKIQNPLCQSMHIYWRTSLPNFIAIGFETTEARSLGFFEGVAPTRTTTTTITG